MRAGASSHSRGYEAFQGPLPVRPLSKFGQSKREFDIPLAQPVSDMTHSQHPLSLLQWNPVCARRRPAQILPAICGSCNATMLQEAHECVPHTTVQNYTCSDGDGMAVPPQFAIVESFTSKSSESLVALVVRGMLRRPPVGALHHCHVLPSLLAQRGEQRTRRSRLVVPMPPHARVSPRL